MKYEFYPEGKNIMDYGEVGDKFYMVIQGWVSVLIPNNFRASLVSQKAVAKDPPPQPAGAFAPPKSHR